MLSVSFRVCFDFGILFLFVHFLFGRAKRKWTPTQTASLSSLYTTKKKFPKPDNNNAEALEEAAHSLFTGKSMPEMVAPNLPPISPAGVTSPGKTKVVSTEEEDVDIPAFIRKKMGM